MLSIIKWICTASIAIAMLSSFSNPTHADESKTEPQPKIELLWPEGAPDAKGQTDNDKPTLNIYPAPDDTNTGTAVVVLPGGGYGGLASDHEGVQIARWFNSLGVSAFVVHYRHRGRGYGHPAPLQDAQRAIRTVRTRAAEWHVKPDHIGIMGFSAGGHLASTAGTHFDAGQSDSPDKIQQASCRPDFLILCYPVISLTAEYTHTGSRDNLLGKDADPALVKSLSNEFQVTKDTPPTFLFHTDGDSGVKPENSVAFYLALRKAGVPAELHVYEKGGHGVGLGRSVPGTSTWSDRLADWLRNRGMLTKG